MSTIPKKFGFIRTTLALWAANVFAGRAGVVTDAPVGSSTSETWGWHDGTGWKYAAKRGGEETFASVTSTRKTANYGIIYGDAMVDDTALSGNAVRPPSQASSVFIIGDSKTAGVGGTSCVSQWDWMFTRSVINAGTNPDKDSSGYGYAARLNMSTAMQEPGFSTTGTYSSVGVAGSRLVLAMGQTITITLREFRYLLVYYNASASAGASISVAYNGTPIATLAAIGAGLQQFFYDTSVESVIGDTYTLTAVGATIQICGIMPMKQSSPSGALVFSSGFGGTTYGDYTSPSVLDEITYYPNAFGARPCLYVIALGTNSVYNPSKAKTPALAVADLAALVSGISSRSANSTFLVEIPEKADEGLWPVAIGGYTFTDYVEEICAWCRTNNHAIIRNDLSPNSLGLNYTDGVHNSDRGHGIRARMFCRALGIPMNTHMNVTSGGDSSINCNLDVRGTAELVSGIGAFGVAAPTARTTVNAACTDLATCVALTNQLRTHLIACGIVQ